MARPYLHCREFLISDMPSNRPDGLNYFLQSLGFQGPYTAYAHSIAPFRWLPQACPLSAVLLALGGSPAIYSLEFMHPSQSIWASAPTILMGSSRPYAHSSFCILLTDRDISCCRTCLTSAPRGPCQVFSGMFQLLTPHHHFLILPPILAPPISAPLFQYRQPAKASVHAMPCTSGRKT